VGFLFFAGRMAAHATTGATMAENTAIQTEIENAVTTAQSVSIDGMSTSSRSISELIAADKHIANKEARRSANLGLRFGIFTPPGHR
jgi:hypothetical protein